MMMASLNEIQIYWVNVIRGNNGDSKNIGTVVIILGRHQIDFNSKNIALQSYEIAYIKTKNDMTSRGVPTISLRPSNNQVAPYFMYFLTRKRFHTYHWEKLPVNNKLIMKTEELP